ncbi:MAG: hypothetical protein RBT60_06810 [Candidatus Krumholzibacteria bacterium]|nr:hypothetical protein [Candidatus Krumholzibacteria bacterium]
MRLFKFFRVGHQWIGIVVSVWLLLLSVMGFLLLIKKKVDWIQPPTRRSDLLERLHDGSLFGGFVHGWFSPLVAVSVAFLTVSGCWLWLAPRRRRP